MEIIISQHLRAANAPLLHWKTDAGYTALMSVIRRKGQALNSHTVQQLQELSALLSEDRRVKHDTVQFSMADAMSIFNITSELVTRNMSVLRGAHIEYVKTIKVDTQSADRDDLMAALSELDLHTLQDLYIKVDNAELGDEYIRTMDAESIIVTFLESYSDEVIADAAEAIGINLFGSEEEDDEEFDEEGDDDLTLEDDNDELPTPEEELANTQRGLDELEDMGFLEGVLIRLRALGPAKCEMIRRMLSLYRVAHPDIVEFLAGNANRDELLKAIAQYEGDGEHAVIEFHGPEYGELTALTQLLQALLVILTSMNKGNMTITVN
jgi:hypothetical protein